MEPLSETEMNEIDRRILRAERLGVHVTLSPRAARGLFEMAKRPTADEESDRLEQELDELRTELATAQVECDRMAALLRRHGIAEEAVSP